MQPVTIEKGELPMVMSALLLLVEGEKDPISKRTRRVRVPANVGADLGRAFRRLRELERQYVDDYNGEIENYGDPVMGGPPQPQILEDNRLVRNPKFKEFTDRIIELNRETVECPFSVKYSDLVKYDDGEIGSLIAALGNLVVYDAEPAPDAAAPAETPAESEAVT